MFPQKAKALRCFLSGVLFVILAGCASSDIVLRPNYQSEGKVAGKSGVVMLAGKVEDNLAGSRVQWVLGEVRESGGKIKGNVVSEVSPSVLVRNSLQQELLRAGYTVPVSEQLPQNADRGLVLDKIMVKQDELYSLVKSESDCQISFSVEVWKKGEKVNTLSFEARSSDFTVRDREKLHTEVMQKALSSAFSRAMPALIEALDK
ncbi:MAG: hypothetical protein RBQ99_06900 [Trichlorobacter sp.]|nr:hypothetical protein [Trichlorobacter sp.]